MNAGKKASVADEHDVNQNEATSNLVRLVDQLVQKIEDPKLLEAEKGMLSEVHKECKDMLCPIPSIVITPADQTSDKEKDESQTSTEGVDSSCQQKEKCVQLLQNQTADNAMLCTPRSDTTLNISRPVENECLKRSLNNTNDEELDGVYRCSSTPIKDKNCLGKSENEENCSMLSIENTSPIIDKNTDRIPVCDSSPSLPDNAHDAHIPGQTEQHMINNQNSAVPNSNDVIIQDTPRASTASSQIPVNSQPPTYDLSSSAGSCHMASHHLLRNHETDAMTGNPGTMYPQHCYNPAGPAFSEYYPTSENSWTDMSCRSDMSPIPTLTGHASTDNNCYNIANRSGQTPGIPDADYFVYPSIYVSSAGLISVLLKNDMSVEMTVDRTIRVVSHHHMMAVATDSRGTTACLYHPAVRIFQVGTTTDIATDNFRARMGSGDSIVFSNGLHYFKLEDSELQPTPPIKFSDIGRDQSVNLLFSSEGYGESLVASCMQVAAQAEYANLPKGGVIVRINGVKVTQTGNGDVSVVTGAKFIRLSPQYGTTRLGNRFVDLEVEKDWTVKVARGSHSFISSRKRSMVCNGKMEAGFDENNGLKVANLMPRHPLLTDVGVRRHIAKPARSLWPPTTPPKRKPENPTIGRGGRTF